MTPSQFRRGAPDAEIKFAVGECSLGVVLVAASEMGVCAILFGDDAESLRNDLKKQFPRARLVGGDEAFEALTTKVIDFVEAPGSGPRPPPRCEGHGVSASRVGRASPHPCRRHRKLCRDCQGDRRTEIGTRGGSRLRLELHCRGDPVPPRGGERRIAVRLSRRRRAQARPSRQRSKVLSQRARPLAARSWR